MPIRPDSLTPKRDYLESRIREHARAVVVPIDCLDWNKPPNQDVSELTIISNGEQKQYVIEHTSDVPQRLTLFAKDRDLDECAKAIVRDLKTMI